MPDLLEDSFSSTLFRICTFAFVSKVQLHELFCLFAGGQDIITSYYRHCEQGTWWTPPAPTLGAGTSVPLCGISHTCHIFAALHLSISIATLWMLLMKVESIYLLLLLAGGAGQEGGICQRDASARRGRRQSRTEMVIFTAAGACWWEGVCDSGNC